MTAKLAANKEQIKKAGEGMGKSGAFMFFSHDERFLLKSMTTEDFNAWMKLFKSYFDHINTFPDSLIARVYGVYSVKLDDMEPVFVLMMGNTKPCNSKYIKKLYDLKGSLVDRISKDKDGGEELFKRTFALKDHNLLNIIDKEMFLRFYKDDAKAILYQMAFDVNLISKFNLMDYSLLFVVVYNERYVEKYPE